jgi:hypothetical protein
MNRCREIPASRSKGNTGGETPFSAFLKSSKGLFWPFFANLFNEMEREGVVYIHYENFTGKTVDPKKIF